MTAPNDKSRSDTIFALAALTVGTIAGTNPGETNSFHSRLGQTAAGDRPTTRAFERTAATVVINTYRAAYTAADSGNRRPNSRRGL